jgi:hypothetical protein
MSFQVISEEGLLFSATTLLAVTRWLSQGGYVLVDSQWWQNHEDEMVWICSKREHFDMGR